MTLRANGSPIAHTTPLLRATLPSHQHQGTTHESRLLLLVVRSPPRRKNGGRFLPQSLRKARKRAVLLPKASCDEIDTQAISSAIAAQGAEPSGHASIFPPDLELARRPRGPCVADHGRALQLDRDNEHTTLAQALHRSLQHALHCHAEDDYVEVYAGEGLQLVQRALQHHSGGAANPHAVDVASRDPDLAAFACLALCEGVPGLAELPAGDVHHVGVLV
mmetsp:Transcript_61474/g.164376  ORF Transcript_61474/g.164376 Transcript_61474/m.164376 type:complete len:220 (-) Transcript_61474:413-1072(-)